MSQKVALVTGASSGIGESTARRLHDAGFAVYGAARRVDRMAALAAAGLHTVALDVTDESSAEKAVAEILAAHGRIDVLVNNAGYGSYGALEDVPMAEARSQIEVNLFGLAHLTRAVLPAMRAQRSGTIINISSMGGRLATPLGAWYHASKFAVEGLSDALRLELRRFGIDVLVIEPGLIRTEWGSIAARKLRATSGEGHYGDQAEAIAVSLENGSRPNAPRTSSPDVVARAATARRPRTRYTVGSAPGRSSSCAGCSRTGPSTHSSGVVRACPPENTTVPPQRHALRRSPSQGSPRRHTGLGTEVTLALPPRSRLTLADVDDADQYGTARFPLEVPGAGVP